MSLRILSKKDQHSVSLFEGRLLENKPLSGSPLFSNLLYWAHVEAPGEGTFPMHPHEGIEILTFIFEGGLEHFDTATDKWTPLPADAVQHIQAGSGLQHSEKYIKDSRAFQIWFNPDFSKSLLKKPQYEDYQADSFHWVAIDGLEVKKYVGADAPITTDAPGISARRYRIPKGTHDIELDIDSYHSLYLMEGSLDVEGSGMDKDSFAKVIGVERLSLVALENSELFVLQSPAQIGY